MSPCSLIARDAAIGQANDDRIEAVIVGVAVAVIAVEESFGEMGPASIVHADAQSRIAVTAVGGKIKCLIGRLAGIAGVGVEFAVRSAKLRSIRDSVADIGRPGCDSICI